MYVCVYGCVCVCLCVACVQIGVGEETGREGTGGGGHRDSGRDMS